VSAGTRCGADVGYFDRLIETASSLLILRSINEGAILAEFKGVFNLNAKVL
jgi:hypothetical protein